MIGLIVRGLVIHTGEEIMQLISSITKPPSGGFVYFVD
jgi:hypothetical protein